MEIDSAKASLVVNDRGLVERLDRVRALMVAVRSILESRRAELGPLLAALGQNAYVDPRPVLTEEALTEFESTHVLKLPDDYRAFLREIGNGGPGPGNGMTELMAPFPHTTLSQRGTVHPVEVSRLVPIASLGCGMSWLLVLAGVDSGNVWYHDEDGFAPCEPRLDFLDWYEGWLMETQRLGRVAAGPGELP